MKKERQKQLYDLLDELIDLQKRQLMKVAKQYVPHITEEDILQPNDFPVLENHPLFRYEEGVLHGMLSVQSAIFAMKRTED